MMPLFYFMNKFIFDHLFLYKYRYRSRYRQRYRYTYPLYDCIVRYTPTYMPGVLNF